MPWKNERLLNLLSGDIFRRKGYVFIYNGDVGKRGGLVDASLLIPLEEQPHCRDNEDMENCKHFLVDGVMYHLALHWPNESLDSDYNPEPGFSVRKRSKEILMRIELYVAQEEFNPPNS